MHITAGAPLLSRRPKYGLHLDHEAPPSGPADDTFEPPASSSSRSAGTGDPPPCRRPGSRCLRRARGASSNGGCTSCRADASPTAPQHGDRLVHPVAQHDASTTRVALLSDMRVSCRTSIRGPPRSAEHRLDAGDGVADLPHPLLGTACPVARCIRSRKASRRSFRTSPSRDGVSRSRISAIFMISHRLSGSDPRAPSGSEGGPDRQLGGGAPQGALARHFLAHPFHLVQHPPGWI